VTRGETAFTRAQHAAADLTLRVTWLDDYARQLEDTGAPLKARIIRHRAALAYRAAKAELANPEPRVRPCGTCHGIRSCDWDIHREVV